MTATKKMLLILGASIVLTASIVTGAKAAPILVATLTASPIDTVVNSPMTFTVQVDNYGDTDAIGVEVFLALDPGFVMISANPQFVDVVVGTPTYVTFSTITPPYPGNQTEISDGGEVDEIPLLSPYAFQVRAYIDGFNSEGPAVACRADTCWVYVRPLLPDLTITTTAPPAIAGQPTTRTYTVTNQGGAPAWVNVYDGTRTFLFVSGTYCGRLRNYARGIPGAQYAVQCNLPYQLGPGESYTFVITFKAPTLLGTYTYTALIDRRNSVVEANEANNSATGTHVVNAGL